MADVWRVKTVDGAQVRLRSGRIGIVNVDVTAPVSGGELAIDESNVTFSLRLQLDQLRTGNFLMQAAARTLVSKYDAHVLSYVGQGEPTDVAYSVVGTAVGGTVEVLLTLEITPIGGDVPLSEIDVTGNASVGTVHLPLPGMGTVDDFSFDVEARLALELG